MLCRNFGEALNLVLVLISITVVLIGAATATSLGWVHWDWFNPSLALSVWIGLIVFGLCLVALSPMH